MRLAKVLQCHQGTIMVVALYKENSVFLAVEVSEAFLLCCFWCLIQGWMAGETEREDMLTEEGLHCLVLRQIKLVLYLSPLMYCSVFFLLDIHLYDYAFLINT